MQSKPITSPAITIQNLHKSYGRVRALRGVNLEVRLGEIFGFLGPNGAGKTTTIRCLLDLIRPNAGVLRVLGLDPQHDPVAVRRRTGYLPGELHVEANMTVEGILRYLNQLRRGKADWVFVRQLAGRLDLDLSIAVKNLSKGNKQKVGLVQALMHRPELLLLDEPTFGLDPLMQQEVLRLVREARQAGATILFSSHILSEIEAIADRVGILRFGEVVEVADTATLVNRSLRRVRVRFKENVDPAVLANLPGVIILSHADDHTLQLQVEGEMDALVKALSAFQIVDLETERPSLEEISWHIMKAGKGKVKHEDDLSVYVRKAARRSHWLGIGFGCSGQFLGAFLRHHGRARGTALPAFPGLSS
jgi:ABC-2 type transport system ATP-binding protein